MCVRQKIDQLGEERVGRPIGQVEDRSLGLILGGPLEGRKPERDMVQDWIAFGLLERQGGQAGRQGACCAPPGRRRGALSQRAERWMGTCCEAA